MYCMSIFKVSSQIQGVDFDQCYNPVAHSDSLRIRITNTEMHRLTVSILELINALQNINVNIH